MQHSKPALRLCATTVTSHSWSRDTGCGDTSAIAELKTHTHSNRNNGVKQPQQPPYTIAATSCATCTHTILTVLRSHSIKMFLKTLRSQHGYGGAVQNKYKQKHTPPLQGPPPSQSKSLTACSQVYGDLLSTRVAAAHHHRCCYCRCQ